MIHATRTVTVGDNESIIDKPIVLYRGDREVEIEFTLLGNEFRFSDDGNVIKSSNASHGQLVLNTPSGENMFSEVSKCHDGNVVFIITKEMIDEFIEIGFYNFQIRLYDGVEMKSRMTIPPVLNGIDIRNPIAAEDEANVVDQGIVDYARIFKDQSNEELPTFDWQGNYNKTEWAHHDVITENRMNKIEDALYSINANVKESDVVVLNALDNVKKDADKYVKEHMAEVEADVDEFERNLNTDVQQFKIDTNAAMTAHKNEVSEVVDGFDVQLAHIENHTSSYINVKEFGVKGDGVTDDTQAIQRCFVYAYRNKKSIDIPNGTYMISKPIIIYGSSNELLGGLRVRGESTELTIFKATSNFTSYNLGNVNTDAKAMFILVNENYLSASDELIASDASNMKHDILLEDFKILGGNNIDYGIWTNNCAYSTFKRLRIRNCSIAGLTNSGSDVRTNFYLNTIEKVRIDGCPTSFALGRGINTSCKFDSCYSVGASECGYRIGGIYMSMINNCIDGCTGTCYDLSGYRGSVTNTGSESSNAVCTFRGGQYTDVIISGGLVYGNFDNADAVHIRCGAGAQMTFENIDLAFDFTETNKELPGYLYNQDYLSTLNLINCRAPKYAKKDDYKKDYTHRGYYSDRCGDAHLRHKSDISYIGYDTFESESNPHMSNAQAIYFGLGTGLGHMESGQDVRWHRPAAPGDLWMTKHPETHLCGAFINLVSGTGMASGGAKWGRLALISAMSTDEIKALDNTKIANGTCIFNTTLGKPVWKKNTNIWVTADGTQI